MYKGEELYKSARATGKNTQAAITGAEELSGGIPAGPVNTSETLTFEQKLSRFTEMSPTVIGGIVLAGYGIWKMIRAKHHIDQVYDQINHAKKELIKDTAGKHDHRPGDNLIRDAFERLTEMYFNKI